MDIKKTCEKIHLFIMKHIPQKIFYDIQPFYEI